MNEKMTFKAIRVPETLMEDIKTLKGAYEERYGKKMTFEEVLRRMVSSLEVGDPAVFEIYNAMLSGRLDMRKRIDALKLQ